MIIVITIVVACSGPDRLEVVGIMQLQKLQGEVAVWKIYLSSGGFYCWWLKAVPPGTAELRGCYEGTVRPQVSLSVVFVSR